MRVLLIVLLAVSCGASLTSCGKRVTNNSGVVQDLRDNSYYYAQCSNVQWANRCLRQPSAAYLPPRYFYARICYDQYVQCLRNNGVNHAR